MPAVPTPARRNLFSRRRPDFLISLPVQLALQPRPRPCNRCPIINRESAYAPPSRTAPHPSHGRRLTLPRCQKTKKWNSNPFPKTDTHLEQLKRKGLTSLFVPKDSQKRTHVRKRTLLPRD